jgi:CheY-like chemotaxis protein
MAEEIEGRMSVVVVDDDPRILKYVREILEERDLLESYSGFEDPIEFMDSLQGDLDPDLLLLDVNFENAGISGVEMIPYIRQVLPVLPIILLTGMTGDVLTPAQDEPLTYFIPKPVSPDHLLRMIDFYLGKSEKMNERMSRLSQQMLEYEELLELLEREDGLSAQSARDREQEAFTRINETLTYLTKNSEFFPSFVKDLKKVYFRQFDLFKKVMATLVQFDTANTSPGSNIHKHKGTSHVYSVRLSKKARLFFYQGPESPKRRILRVDTDHDTKGMDKWLKANYANYAD